MMENAKCSKCDGELIDGFIVDHAHYNAKREQVWVEGLPKPAFWTDGLKTSDRAVHSVRTLRCADCGFLESYAVGEIDRDGGLSELFGS